MNEKFNKNEKVENFTSMLGIAVRLIVIDPLCMFMHINFCAEIDCILITKLKFRQIDRTNVLFKVEM